MKVKNDLLEIEDLEKLIQDVLSYRDEGQYQLITCEELSHIQESEKIILIDTMEEELYLKRHIDGALNLEGSFKENEIMPLNKQQKLKKILGDNLDKKIVFYSSRVNCRRSHVMAKWSIKLGYKNVFKLIGGTLSWKDKGYKFIKPEVK